MCPVRHRSQSLVRVRSFSCGALTLGCQPIGRLTALETDHHASRAENVFVLYINGENQQTPSAVRSLRMLCDRYYPAACELTIVDVAERPDLALHAGVLATPTLVRVNPKPERRLTGTVSCLP